MKVSVIIPSYNRSTFLQEAINSLLIHKPTIYEIIIADDGSTDKTTEITTKYQKKKTKTKIIVSRTEKNYGAQVARNRGFVLASGNIILFMDSDDVITKNGLEEPLEILSKQIHLDFVYGQVIKTDKNLKPYSDSEIIGKAWLAGRDIADYHWHTMGAIYKKEFLTKVGGWDEELQGSQDWEFQTRVKLAGGKGEFVKSVIGYWRDHNESRIGTKKFNYFYVKSVLLACEKVAKNANCKNKLDAFLAKKIAKRVLFHAIEFSVNGYRKERNQSLKEAWKYLKKSNNVVGSTLFSYRFFFPSAFDSISWYFLNRKLS